MNVDPRNLQIKLWRGRTQTIALRVGTWVANTPLPGGQQTFAFQPGNIVNWWWAFTMRTNYTLKQPQIALTYNPITNILDSRQGQMGFNIVYSDLEPLVPGNYVFDIAVSIGGGQPRFFCGGSAILYDNVTDAPVTTATKYPKK